jgi:hypothetical protein
MSLVFDSTEARSLSKGIDEEKDEFVAGCQGNILQLLLEVLSRRR